MLSNATIQLYYWERNAPWFLESVCRDLQCRRTFPVAPSPASSQWPSGRCRRPARQPQREPATQFHFTDNKCVKTVMLDLCTTNLVVEEDWAARFELVFVDECENTDVVFAADWRRDDGVVVVNDLLKTSHRHWCSTQVVHLRSLFLQPQQQQIYL